jgi:hypothetical protein
MLTCLKRVSNRDEHITLEGSEEHRCRIVLAFANLYRNFSLSPYNIAKYFSGKLEFQFNNEDCLDAEKDADLLELFKEVLLGGKPGNFDYAHPKLDLLVEAVKAWNLQEKPREESVEDALQKLLSIFSDF